MIYSVEKLYGSSVDKVHATRLILYRPDEEGSSVSAELIDLAELKKAHYELIEKIMDFR